jgi:FAD/FMN-containing dehydrogenase
MSVELCIAGTLLRSAVFGGLQGSLKTRYLTSGESEGSPDTLTFMKGSTMRDVQISTVEGREVSLTPAVVDAYRANLLGTLLKGGDAGYDEARALWNGMIDRRPALIARCAGAADVITSVRFAREHNILVSVKGAGHNIAGKASSDGSLMIDLSPMKWVHVDPEKKTAHVGPGATLRMVDHETQAFGLAIPLGINSTTGIAGLTLGGGFGWLSRGLGLTIDNLISADIVTADGTLRRASQNENADLFWGIRGGGGNFGIVTSFQFRLHPVGPQVLAGLIVHPFKDAKAVLQQYRSFVAKAPDKLTCWTVLRKAPPLPFLPAEVHGKEVIVIALVYAGEIKEGERLIEPLRKFGHPVGEHLGSMPFAAFQQAFDPLLTAGARNYWKSHNFTEIPDGLIDSIVNYSGNLPSPHTEVFVAHLGAAINRVPKDATAYPHRDTNFVLNVHTRWETANEDAKCIAWAREVFDVTGKYATGGVYVNFISDGEERVASAFGGNFDRLAKLKQKYDPANFFRTNQNVRPVA